MQCDIVVNDEVDQQMLDLRTQRDYLDGECRCLICEMTRAPTRERLSCAHVILNNTDVEAPMHPVPIASSADQGAMVVLDNSPADTTELKFKASAKHMLLNPLEELRSKRPCLDFMFSEVYFAELMHDQVLV